MNAACFADGWGRPIPGGDIKEAGKPNFGGVHTLYECGATVSSSGTDLAPSGTCQRPSIGCAGVTCVHHRDVVPGLVADWVQ